jgi:transketolase
MTSEATQSMDYREMQKLVWNCRARVLAMSANARSAHAGSALSCVEILIVLFNRKYRSGGQLDKIILSKGHAAMALYAAAEQFELISKTELDNYLQDGTQLWGHPSKSSGFKWIDWSTGSLGHGLPAAVGMAYHRKILARDMNSSRIHHAIAVVLSDGECDEGSNWEAILFAGHHKLSNLIVFVDYNKIQSLSRVEQVMNLEPFSEKWRSFGWECIEVDGHSISALDSPWRETLDPTKPLCVVCHTIKGKGVPDIENTVLSHYRPITAEQVERYRNA